MKWNRSTSLLYSAVLTAIHLMSGTTDGSHFTLPYSVVYDIQIILASSGSETKRTFLRNPARYLSLVFWCYLHFLLVYVLPNPYDHVIVLDIRNLGYPSTTAGKDPSFLKEAFRPLILDWHQSKILWFLTHWICQSRLLGNFSRGRHLKCVFILLSKIHWQKLVNVSLLAVWYFFK